MRISHEPIILNYIFKKNNNKKVLFEKFSF